MAHHRSASTLLFTLIAAIILFAVFAGIGSLNALEKYAYEPSAGWQQPVVNRPAGIIGGVCGPDKTTTGFPLADSRQAEIPNNCMKATNPLARAMNYALYFAASAIIAVGTVGRLKGLRV